MKWIIDRFEGDFAVAECGEIYFNIPKNALPNEAREGDVLEIKINRDETKSKEEQLKKRLNNLFGD